MQNCINVRSSRNDKVRHLAWKGRNKKKEKRKACQKAAQWTEFIGEIQKVNNPLTKHTDPESEKLYQKLMHKIKSARKIASSLYVMKKYIKNQVYTNWLWTKCNLVMCPAHWKVWC